jgi:uncharacterized membrane protein
MAAQLEMMRQQYSPRSESVVRDPSRYTVPMLGRRAWLALTALAIFASALALVLRLGHSLSVDEPFMANSVQLPWRELWATFRTDNAPLAYILLRLWTGTVGDSELALRGLSIVAYAVAVFVTGLAASPRGSLAAITAAALAASSVRIGITHAATARPYALLAAFCAAATFFTIQSLDTSPKRRNHLLFAALTTVHFMGLLTHPTYVFVLVACTMAGAIALRDLRVPSVIAGGTALLLYTVLWGRIVWSTFDSQATSWMQPTRLADVKTAFLFLWGTGPGFMLAGALLMLTLSSFPRSRELLRDRCVKWAALAAVLGWSTPILVSLWVPVFLPARTPVLLLPFTAVFIAFILRAVASRAAVLALVSLLVVAAAGQVIDAARAGDPSPSAASIRELLSGVACGDVIVAVGLAQEPADYYVPRLRPDGCIRVEGFPSNMLNWTRRMTDESEMRRVQAEAVSLVTRLSSTARAVWVITADTGMGHEASDIFIAVARDRLSCGKPLPLKGAFFDHVSRCGQ